MEWWKLFSGTFVLIFLAELGDKTQLAALAKTADSPDNSMAKWIVFLGASAALVGSTFIAVFLGHILKSVVPDERYIRLAAAVLFLIFGFSILYETYSSFRTAAQPAAVAPASSVPSSGSVRASGGREDIGVMGGLALRAAMDFEAVTRDWYRRLAKNASPELSAVLRELAKEEESHLAHLRELTSEEKSDEVWEKASVLDKHDVAGRDIAVTEGDRQTLRALLQYEEDTASFYRDLAGRTLIPSVRSVLLHLSSEESGHAERLRKFA